MSNINSSSGPLFIYGDDISFLQFYETRFLRDFCDLQKLSYSIDSEESLDRFNDQILNISLFANTTVVVLNVVPKFFSDFSTNFENQKLHEVLGSYKAFLISVVFDKADKKVSDQIKGFVEKYKMSVYESNVISSWQEHELSQKISFAASLFELEFSHDSLKCFYEYINNRQELLISELTKLSVFMFPERKVSVAVLKVLFDQAYNLDDIFTAFNTRNFTGFFDKVKFLLMNYDPIYFIAILQNKLRFFFQLKSLLESGKSHSEISVILKVNQYRLKYDVKAINNLRSDEIEKCILFLSDIEYQLKTGGLNPNYFNVLFLKLNSALLIK